MRVIIGTDHGGYSQKEQLLAALRDAGYEVEDMGTHSAESTDYAEYAVKVGRAVQQDPNARGILLCRSGEGMEIAANKLKGIRAALVWRPDIAAETRRDNDSNILVLPADFVAEHDMLAIARSFLDTDFSGEERHQRRIDQIKALETE
ncbi:MAG: RpiB/LacA/LacB family sugar-phosphate isomerase [Candidatus Paceibacterota bacterium]